MRGEEAHDAFTIIRASHTFSPDQAACGRPAATEHAAAEEREIRNSSSNKNGKQKANRQNQRTYKQTRACYYTTNTICKCTAQNIRLRAIKRRGTRTKTAKMPGKCGQNTSEIRRGHRKRQTTMVVHKYHELNHLRLVGNIWCNGK